MKEARGGGRYNGRLMPAVEYLQPQRVRMMMMMKLAEATAHVDVYVVASNNTGGEGGRGGRGAASDGDDHTRGDDAAGAGGRRTAATAKPDAAPFRDGQPGLLSGDQRAERLRRERQPDQRDVLRAAVWRDGGARAGEGVSGRGRFPPEASDGARHLGHENTLRQAQGRRLW